jgi:hypothetical protein
MKPERKPAETTIRNGARLTLMYSVFVADRPPLSKASSPVIVHPHVPSR